MESLVHILLGNALAATFLAVVALGVGRICRRPALTHSLWLIVLLKLVTPPLMPVSFPARVPFRSWHRFPQGRLAIAKLARNHALNRSRPTRR